MSINATIVTPPECKLRMADLHSPTTTIYGVLFIITSTIAGLGNTIAIIVLWLPGVRSKSNRILTSLAISDALVGYVLIPLNAYQLFSSDALTNCPVDVVRAYTVVVLCGSSALTLAIIAYDRYILLTKLNNYDLHMSRKKIVLLLLGAWLLPALVPILRYVGIPSTPYIVALLALFGAPFFILPISYYSIAKEIYQQEKTLCAYKNEETHEEPITTTSNAATDENDAPASESAIVAEDKKARAETLRMKHKHLRLAKAVSVLIVCYFLCFLPVITWLVLTVTNVYTASPVLDSYSMQNLYIFITFTISGNSCLNPCIYAVKNPDFRRGLRKLLTRKRGEQIHPN